MYFKRKQQTRIIHSNSAEDFEDRLNECLSELADAGTKYELTFNNTMGFCAYIVYTQTIDIPESLAEEYELNGERHVCTECNYCDIPNDKRFKNFRCKLHGCKVDAQIRCCDDFYADMEKFMRKEVSE